MIEETATVKLPHDLKDPRNLKGRVIRRVAYLLDQLEADETEQLLPFRDQIAALTALGRLLMIFRSLRADDDDGRAGSAVRKYAPEFQKAHGADRRAAETDAQEPIDDDDDDDDAGFTDKLGTSA